MPPRLISTATNRPRLVKGNIPADFPQGHQLWRTTAPAFTLVECLVTLGVVLILISLALPSVGRVRQSSREIACQSNVRTLGSLVAGYTLDFRGFYPTWIGAKSESNPSSPYWLAYSSQYQRLFFTDRWMRYAGHSPQSKIYRCPENQWVKTEGASPSDFWGVAAMFTDASYLSSTTPRTFWERNCVASPQLVDSIRFTSQKVLVYEQIVWHGWAGDYRGRINGLHFFDSPNRSSMYFADGHASGFRYSETLPGVDRSPIWYSANVILTESGIEGRDIN